MQLTAVGVGDECNKTVLDQLAGRDNAYVVADSTALNLTFVDLLFKMLCEKVLVV